MPCKITITLTEDQRQHLIQICHTGQAPARKLLHARILLKADASAAGPQWSDPQISEALDVSLPTIGRVRRRCATAGLDAALDRQPQPPRPALRRVDGAMEAQLIALTGGPNPDGDGRWSLRLLATELVKAGLVAQISHETVRQVLKKTCSSRG